MGFVRPRGGGRPARVTDELDRGREPPAAVDRAGRREAVRGERERRDAVQIGRRPQDRPRPRRQRGWEPSR